MSDASSERALTQARLARALLCAVGLGAIVGRVPNAFAQGGKTVADSLFEEGKNLLQAGDWPGACAKFQASFEADAAVSTLVKIARCQEHEGKLTRALVDYRRALELNQNLPQTPERRADLDTLIREDLSALDVRVPKLLFAITPRATGLEVVVNGTLVPEPLAAPVAVDPGEPEVIVRAPGYREERRTLRAPEGATLELAFRLVPDAGKTAPVPTLPPSAPPGVAPLPGTEPVAAPGSNDARAGEPGSGQRTFGAVLGGAGVVALGVAAYFGVKTLVLVNAARPRCPDSECDPDGYRMVHDARDAQTVGLIVGGSGAALLGTGIALYFTAPAERQKRTSLSARLGPTGIGLGGSF